MKPIRYASLTGVYITGKTSSVQKYYPVSDRDGH